MNTSGKGGSLYLALIGLSLALLGGAFVFFLGRAYLRAAETRDWSVRPGVVVKSTVGERVLGPKVPTEYTHKLAYRYEIDGETYFGNRVGRRENPFFKEREKVKQWVEEWPVGRKVEVFVNPQDPEEALLDHETKAPGYSIWFPGLFLVGGLVVFVKALGGLFRNRQTESGSSDPDEGRAKK